MSALLTTGDPLTGKVQKIEYRAPGCVCTWGNVRPIPEDDDWFENVWRKYAEQEVIR